MPATIRRCLPAAKFASIGLAVFLLVASLSHLQAAEKKTAADTVLLGGKIITLDGKNSITEALAVRMGKILAVGSDAEIEKLIGKQTKVIRLGGKTVIPGIIETHCHAIGVGRNALVEKFVELTSIAQIQDWVREKSKRTPPSRWIVVPRTDITRIAERRHPTPAELDAAAPKHPVFLNAARKNVLNTLGLKMMEIDQDAKSIPGGKIIRDSEGRILMFAGGNFRGRLPRREFTEAETLAGMKKVHHIYNQVGITSIFERATNLEGYQLYEKLRDDGQLTVRCSATFRQQFREGKQVEEFAKKLGLKTGDGDDWVRVGALKITVDGGIHWGSTYLSEPYGKKRSKFYVLDDPNYRGDRRYTIQQMRDIFATGHRFGWQMSCHVTGDGGVDAVLSALEQAGEVADVRSHRFNLIHAYFPNEDLVRRCRRLGVCVDTQGFLYYKDSDAIAEVYGRDWAERFIGMGAWHKGGVPTAINSDHMIGLDPDKSMNAFNPFLQIYIAVSRKNENGRVYGAHQKLSRVDALRSMTSTAAVLSFDEQKKGSLEAGKLADLAVLDRDYLTCPEEEIRRIKVLQTMVDGKIVYRRK